MAEAPEKAEPAEIPKDEQHPRDPSKRKEPRRCAKCASPAGEAAFKTETGMSPYCAPCRGRFPSLAAPRLAVAKTRSPRRG